jgi:tRNA pseudouridine synthase 10
MYVHSLLTSKNGTNAIDILMTIARSGFGIAHSTLEKLGETPPTPDQCYLCEDLFTKLDEYAELGLQESTKFSFATFLVGTSGMGKFIDREDELRSQFNILMGESIKSEFNRELGKTIEKISGKKASTQAPDAVFIYDLAQNCVNLQINPLFIFGRYQKLVRGIPQAPWICSSCEGKGCQECQGTGRNYETSIEELIVPPAVSMTTAQETKFHAAGREDIDVRTIGSGRPFVIELKKPKLRAINLDELQRKINEFAAEKVEVSPLTFTCRLMISKLKTQSRTIEKTYVLRVELGRPAREEDIKTLEETLSQAVIEQRTPSRVLHRRTDKLRKRRIRSLTANIIRENELELRIRCEGGLYVKELVHGDHGRTEPSVSCILQTEAISKTLDILDIHFRG